MPRDQHTVPSSIKGAAVPVWVIPQSRMKNLGRDQRVPLVGRALAIARELTGGRDPEAPVFGHHRPINPNAIRKSVLPKLLKSIGHEAPAVTHGFRSCLKDWCHETTSFPHEVIEQALGHRIRARSNAATGAAICSSVGGP